MTWRKAIDSEKTPSKSVTLREGVKIEYPGNTTGAVYEWMRVHSLRVSATKLIGQRRAEHGKATYRVTFATDPR